MQSSLESLALELTFLTSPFQCLQTTSLLGITHKPPAWLAFTEEVSSLFYLEWPDRSLWLHQNLKFVLTYKCFLSNFLWLLNFFLMLPFPILDLALALTLWVGISMKRCLHFKCVWPCYSVGPKLPCFVLRHLSIHLSWIHIFLTPETLKILSSCFSFLLQKGFKKKQPS